MPEHCIHKQFHIKLEAQVEKEHEIAPKCTWKAVFRAE